MRRLYTRIYLQMLLVLVAAGLAVLVVSAVGYRGEYRRGLGHRVTTVASALGAERFDDPAARRAAVERLAHELDLDLTVRDLDGNLLVATGEPLPAVGGREAEALDRRDQVFVRGAHPFAAAVIRTRDGRPLGVLQAALPGVTTPWLLQHLAVIAVVLLVIALTARPLARRISKPVERLTEATRRFGHGELDYRIRPPAAGGAGRGDELARLEQAWDEMAERIETLVRSHRELLANVSHELRSPLARLRVLMELLPSSPEVEARAGEIERELADLDRLVEALLTVARLEAAALPISRERASAAALLESVRGLGQGDPRLAGVEVHGPADLEIEGDLPLLRRALWNLLENAAKYGAAPITLFAEPDGDSVRLGVTDMGPGIGAAERERMLAPFVRGREHAGATGAGFGLGLTLASRIAAAHGGALRIEAAVADATGERGCRVSLAIPAGARGREPAAQAAASV